MKPRLVDRITHKVRTETNHYIELTGDQIFEALGLKRPKDSAVYVRVPGGGDWSNTRLDISEETVVVVEWTEVKEG